MNSCHMKSLRWTQKTRDEYVSYTPNQAIVINVNNTTEKMVQMGYNLRDIQESLAEVKHDELCATYQLLGIHQQQQLLANASSSSLSPVGLEMTPQTPSSTAPRGDMASSFSKQPHPSPSSKQQVTGTRPAVPPSKKVSAPGVLPSAVSIL